MKTKNKDKISISPEDRELFRNTVKNSLPLKENKKQYFKKKPIAKEYKIKVRKKYNS